ncbi:MAG: acylphosphatase [Olegusella sp.]|nr:acylphosphatase [Olegusella sp.]
MGWLSDHIGKGARRDGTSGATPGATASSSPAAGSAPAPDSPAAAPGPSSAAAGSGDRSAERRLHIVFRGEVQGVGFRWNALHVADALSLCGWVRNEWDGSVTMELQGSDDQIARFFTDFNKQYRHFPINYVIDEKEDIPLRDDEGGFQVLFS